MHFWAYPDRRITAGRHLADIDVAHHGQDRCSLPGGSPAAVAGWSSRWPGKASERFPCLVDLKQVRAADQIWATEIIYIPLQKGFLYLVAIVALFSRNVLG